MWQRSECGEETYQQVKPGEDGLLDAIHQKLREREAKKRFSMPSNEAMPPLGKPMPDFETPRRSGGTQTGRDEE